MLVKGSTNGVKMTDKTLQNFIAIYLFVAQWYHMLGIIVFGHLLGLGCVYLARAITWAINRWNLNWNIEVFAQDNTFENIVCCFV